MFQFGVGRDVKLMRHFIAGSRLLVRCATRQREHWQQRKQSFADRSQQTISYAPQKIPYVLRFTVSAGEYPVRV
jgi:hypothetical protein